MTPRFVVERLGPAHDRKGFRCGIDALDSYFHDRVGQDVRRRTTACFVACEVATGRVAAYYTLAAAGVLLADMPASLRKRLPRYPSVPVARLGRLAVALTHRGLGLGGALLWDAVERAARSEVAGIFALVADAKDEEAERFYEQHGFVALASASRTLIRGAHLAAACLPRRHRGALAFLGSLAAELAIHSGCT